MSGIIAHWELPVVMHDGKIQKKEYIKWSHTAKAYGIHRICLVDVDGIAPVFGDDEIELTIASTLEEALSQFPHCDQVWVEEGGTDIAEYIHPGNPVYIFGSDFSELSRADVSLPTMHGIHAVVSCGIVLNDRKVKWHLQ